MELAETALMTDGSCSTALAGRTGPRHGRANRTNFPSDPISSRSKTSKHPRHHNAPVATRSISMLFAEPSTRGDQHRPHDRSYASDLNLDRLSRHRGSREETEFIATLLYQPVTTSTRCSIGTRSFVTWKERRCSRASGSLRTRADGPHSPEAGRGMRYRYQREGWFLDAVAGYCDAVRALAGALMPRHASRPVPWSPSTHS